MENSIKNNLEKVSYLINESKEKSKCKQNVTLIAVSKTVDVDKIKEAIDLGIQDFGENKPQELLRKSDFYPNVKWHQIGTLQRNKVKHIIERVTLIHSLDSLELAEEINKRAVNSNIKIPCLIQVNISHEDTKHGINENKIFDFVKIISENYGNIKLEGLMGMAPFELDKEKTRPYFQKLKELELLINQKKINDVKLKELSMGMSNDFQIAIEEGATLVRVGTDIFGQRNYNL